MQIWSKDPKNGKESVSLTFLQITFTGCILGAAFESAGLIKSTGVMLELFYVMVGLYFFRRTNITSKSFSIGDTTSKPTDKQD